MSNLLQYSADTCPVCLEDLDNLGIPLECGHQYHGKCIVPWLQRGKSCPVCRDVPSSTEREDDNEALLIAAARAINSTGGNVLIGAGYLMFCRNKRSALNLSTAGESENDKSDLFRKLASLWAIEPNKQVWVERARLETHRTVRPSGRRVIDPSDPLSDIRAVLRAPIDWDVDTTGWG